MKICKTITAVILGFSALSCAFAKADFHLPLQTANNWSITFNTGFARYQDADDNQGKTMVGRLGFSREFFNSGGAGIGLELGLQSGNTMRFDIPKENLEILGGVPIVGTMKPMLDVLLTLTMSVDSGGSMYTILKGGASYRQLQMDRETVNDLARFNPELQAGVGYSVNNFLQTSLIYQRIFGKNIAFQVDEIIERGVIANIPTQDAVFFGLKLLF